MERTTVRLTMLLALAALPMTGCYVYEDDCHEYGDCGSYQNPQPTPVPAQYATIDRWADAAYASSNGMDGTTDYAEVQALGDPDVGFCGDNALAWSPVTANPVPGVSQSGDTIDDWIELTFSEYMWVRQVKIYESYNPGAIVAVDLEASDNAVDPLPIFENFSGNGPGGCPSAFVITIDQGTTYEQYDRVVIYLDSNLVGDSNGLNGPNDDFNEIDAVLMVGDVRIN